jgi:hypothetical protein
MQFMLSTLFLWIYGQESNTYGGNSGLHGVR